MVSDRSWTFGQPAYAEGPCARTQISSSSQGFTLIEIMIVLAILAIILAIAYPAYTEQVRKARRADAVSSLTQQAQLLERCFTRFSAYNNAGCIDPEGASVDGFYAITVVRTATSFTLTATPNGSQSADRCGTYTLDYLGNKTPAPGGARCWGSS